MLILLRMQEVFQDVMDVVSMTSQFETQALGSLSGPAVGILPQPHSSASFAAHLDKAMEPGRHESPKPELKETRPSHSRPEVRPPHKPASMAPGGTIQVPAAPILADPQTSPDPQALSLDPSGNTPTGTAPDNSAGSTASGSPAQPPNQQPPVQPTQNQQKQDSPAPKGQQPSAASQAQAAQSQPPVAKDASTSNAAQQPGADAAKADAQAQAARLLAAAEAAAFKLPPAAPEAAPGADTSASSRDGGQVDSRLRGNDEKGAPNFQRQVADNRPPETSRQAGAKTSADSNPSSSKQDTTPQLTTSQMTAGEDAVTVNPLQAPSVSNGTEAVLGKAQPSGGSTAGPAILPSPSTPVQATMPAMPPTNTGGGQTGTDSDASSRQGNTRVPSQDSTGARVQPPVDSEAFSLHDLAPSAAVSPSTQPHDSALNKSASPLPSGSSPAQEQALAAWQNVNSQIGRIVNAAALYQAATGVEMRLQLRTETLGPVEIRAALNGDKLGAAIGVQNPEAHATLTNQLPALQQSLVNHNVQVEHLAVFNGAAGGNMNLGSGSGQHAEHFAPPASRPVPSGADGISAAPPPRAEVLSLENGPRRLSVRA